MDKKKNTIIGIVVAIAGAVGLIYVLTRKKSTPIPPIVYSNPQASNYLYNPDITAWSCVAYQVTIANNTSQNVTIGYNVHIKAYNTATPSVIKYDEILYYYSPGYMSPVPNHPVFMVTITAYSSITQIFNLSSSQVQLQLGDTMELSLIDQASGYTVNELLTDYSLSFSGDIVEAKGTETPIAIVSM